MTFVKYNCQSCGRPIDVSVGQQMIEGRVRWYQSYQCPYCGFGIEADGVDDTPEEIRQALLAEEGEWALDVPESSPQALKLLRQALGLSLSELQAVKKRLPGIVTTGTRAEMERLQYLLSSGNVQSSVIRVNSPPS